MYRKKVESNTFEPVRLKKKAFQPCSTEENAVHGGEVFFFKSSQFLVVFLGSLCVQKLTVPGALIYELFAFLGR